MAARGGEPMAVAGPRAGPEQGPLDIAMELAAVRRHRDPRPDLADLRDGRSATPVRGGGHGSARHDVLSPRPRAALRKPTDRARITGWLSGLRREEVPWRA
jgi:hypothetical protein